MSSTQPKTYYEIVEEMTWAGVTGKSDGRGRQQHSIATPDRWLAQAQRQLQELVNYAFETDPNRLLNLILKMNSTIRHFETASYLLNHLLQLRKLQGLLPLDCTYACGIGSYQLSAQPLPPLLKDM